MELRIQGLPGEIEKLVHTLSQIPGLIFTRETKNYPNRNNNQFRRYISFEIREEDGNE